MANNAPVASIGVISDTHYMERCFALPPTLPGIWAGVDFILHAGDVGDLSVLDELGRIAPAVAVHGNDEPEPTQRALPGQQLIPVGGQRILLWHSHYPDPAEEKAHRGGAWGPKLDRIAACGREAGASVVIFGHSHVPMLSRQGDVWLFNPGAVASGSYFTRQAAVSVGRLRLAANGACQFSHLDAATGQPVRFPEPDPGEEFGILARQYQHSIVEAGLAADVAALGRLAYDDVRAVVRAVIPLYRQCLARSPMLRADLIQAIAASPELTARDRAQVLAVLDGCRPASH